MALWLLLAGGCGKADRKAESSEGESAGGAKPAVPKEVGAKEDKRDESKKDEAARLPTGGSFYREGPAAVAEKRVQRGVRAPEPEPSVAPEGKAAPMPPAEPVAPQPSPDLVVVARPGSAHIDSGLVGGAGGRASGRTASSMDGAKDRGAKAPEATRNGYGTAATGENRRHAARPRGGRPQLEPPMVVDQPAAAQPVAPTTPPPPPSAAPTPALGTIALGPRPARAAGVAPPKPRPATEVMKTLERKPVANPAFKTKLELAKRQGVLSGKGVAARDETPTGDDVGGDADEDGEEVDEPEDDATGLADRRGRKASADKNQPVRRRGRLDNLLSESKVRRVVDRERANDRHRKPPRFLPRKAYFENTYLGGSAAYRHALARLDAALGDGPHRLAAMYPQQFDPPARAGLGVTASLDTRWIDKPGRVLLQVGLQGSHRFGWRRPPLELVLVLDTDIVASGPAAVVEALGALLLQLGPQDRLGVVVAGAGEPLVPLGSIRELRMMLAERIRGLSRGGAASAADLRRALQHAGRILGTASLDRTTLPGTQIVLLYTGSSAPDRVAAAAEAAHGLTLQGIVTSVLERGASAGAWWSVANAGYGNYHAVGNGKVGDAIHAELDALSKVVARLVRVNVRLAEGVHAVRVLGSRILTAVQVTEVKEREKASDRSLSKAWGIKADRGEDDDGLQTVIPYFYGGDAHVIVIELWVDKPGPVADVSLRYKDMVRLSNETARTSVRLRNVPRAATAEQRSVVRNAHGLRIAEALRAAAARVAAGDRYGALARLQAAADLAAGGGGADDARMLTGYGALVSDAAWTSDGARRRLLADSLELAGRRKAGERRYAP